MTLRPLLGRVEEEFRRLSAERDQLRQERDAANVLLETSELRCSRLSRQIEQLEAEVVDTAITAEAIISAPTPQDDQAALVAKLELAVVELLAIAKRATHHARYTGREFDASRVHELGKVVSS